MDYEVEGQWNNDDSKWVYEAKAVNKAGRVLGKVNATVQSDDAAHLEFNIGGNAMAEIEKSTQETLDIIIKHSQQQTN